MNSETVVQVSILVAAVIWAAVSAYLLPTPWNALVAAPGVLVGLLIYWVIKALEGWER